MTEEELTTAAREWLGISPSASGPDVDALDIVVPAVVAFIGTIPDVPEASEWPEHVALGATMLAGRLVRRRNSPQGVAAFTEAGGAAYVSRIDPDVAQMLRLGRYAAPQVG